MGVDGPSGRHLQQKGSLRQNTGGRLIMREDNCSTPGQGSSGRDARGRQQGMPPFAGMESGSAQPALHPVCWLPARASESQPPLPALFLLDIGKACATNHHSMSSMFTSRQEPRERRAHAKRCKCKSWYRRAADAEDASVASGAMFPELTSSPQPRRTLLPRWLPAGRQALPVLPQPLQARLVLLRGLPLLLQGRTQSPQSSRRRRCLCMSERAGWLRGRSKEASN